VAESQRITSGFALVVALFARQAGAASFGWSAPDGCPAEASVRARLERDFGADFDVTPGLDFEATVTQGSGSFELVLKARARDGAVQERRIRAATCDELVDALVAAMALARQALESPPPDSEPAAADAEPEPEPTTPAASPTRKATPADSAELAAVLALGGLLDVGALPSPAFGAEALAGLEWPSLELWVRGALTTPNQSTLEGGAGEFDLAFGGASACYAPQEAAWELSGCVTGEVGRIRGVGVGVENARVGTSLWLALVPSARVAFRPSPRLWGLFAEVGAVLPLTRRPFELSGVGVVHQPSPVGLRTVAGIELGFR
jgi:hypothetical protein